MLMPAAMPSRKALMAVRMAAIWASVMLLAWVGLARRSHGT